MDGVRGRSHPSSLTASTLAHPIYLTPQTTKNINKNRQLIEHNTYVCMYVCVYIYIYIYIYQRTSIAYLTPLACQVRLTPRVTHLSLADFGRCSIVQHSIV